jgi:predicted nucleotidyltransferase
MGAEQELEVSAVSDAVRAGLRLHPQLLEELRAGLRQLYGERLRGLYLYGSYARGEAGLDSDADILIVLDQVGRYGAEIDRSGKLISDLSLKYDVCLSRVIVTETRWKQDNTAFLENVREEAVAV